MNDTPDAVSARTVAQAPAGSRALAFFNPSPEILPQAALLNAQRVRWVCGLSATPLALVTLRALTAADGAVAAGLHASLTGAFLMLAWHAHGRLQRQPLPGWLAPVVVALLVAYTMLASHADAATGRTGWASHMTLPPLWTAALPWCVCAAAAALKLTPRMALLLLGGWLLWALTLAPGTLAWAPALLSLWLSLLGWRQFQTAALLQRQLEAAHEALAAKHRELEFLSRHDPLTGLHNRREFAQLADMELARARRYETPTCVLIADLDHFRVINQRHGQPAGDKVLKHVAQLLLRHVRVTDLVGRLGGEEFIILLPQTDLPGARKLAEKLRKAVSLSPAMDGIRPINVTISIGLSATQPGGLDNLYRSADEALAQAKRTGRNKVMVG